MQIDFHHAVTYICARLAGFEAADAATIAHAAQYVDDAVNTGSVSFTNGAMYARISSAHKMLDYRNFQALADALVWVPFHFLPGNGGLPAGQDPPGSFIQKLVCRPNSPVARDMIRSVIEMKRVRHTLHRLGITMHTFADTWAHQGFAGVPHEINHATDLMLSGEPDTGLLSRLQNYFINAALPLGHGTVLSNPDKPYLHWSYTNGKGERIERANPKDYVEAANEMTRAMQQYLADDPDLDAPGLPAVDREVMRSFFISFIEDDPDRRHGMWLDQIRSGTFSFGAEDVQYIAAGVGSWKHTALGALEDADDESGFAYSPEFLRSDWKLFHDALQAHRLDVVYQILPEYGICSA